VIVNMTEVAKALHVDPAYPTKYFGIELGAQSKYDLKSERAIVNGCHGAPDLAKILDKFIERFVLCPTCKLPELKLEVKKSQLIIDCAACGYNGSIPDTHKMVSYIVKDHKDPGDKKKGDKKSKDKDKDKDKEKKGSDDEANNLGKENDDEVEWFTDTSKEAQQKRKEAEFGQQVKISKEAVKESKSDTPVGVLAQYLRSGNRSPEEVAAEVKRLQLARGLDEPQKIKVLLEAALDVKNGATIAKQYKDRAKLLAKFAGDRASASILIGCIEEQVGVGEPKLVVKMPMILQALYEEGVLDEETIVSWAEAPAESAWLVPKEVAVKVRKAAVPFVNWLKKRPRRMTLRVMKTCK